MSLEPGGLLMWIIVGLVAGFLAGQFMKGSSYGLIGDLIVGIVGAFVGGFLGSIAFPGAVVGLFGSIVVAFVGAVVFIAVARAIAPRRGIFR